MADRCICFLRAVTEAGVCGAVGAAGAGARPTIQPGNFTSIYGDKLALPVANWHGEFSTSLNGVSVTINGKPAYMVYVSPTQVNVQAPDDTTQGPVTVQLTTPAGTTISTVGLSPESPSFSLLDAR